MHFDRHLVVGLTRFLPPWLAAFALAWLFWTLLQSPARFGWETATAFETILFVEIGLLAGAVLVLPMRGGALSVPASLLVIGGLGVGLSASVSPLAATLIALHLGARIGAAWRDRESSRALVISFSLSGTAFVLAWFAAALFWQHHAGWTPDIVPAHLWWEVPSPQGIRRMPHAFPLIGFLYFASLTFAELLRVAVQFFQADPIPQAPPTESA